jgi:type I restriction enzyme S subunit
LKRLAHYFDERRTKVSDKDYRPLSVTKNGIVPQLDTAAKTDDSDNRKLVLAGDFVINSRSDRKGSSGLSTLDGSVSLINTVLEPNSDIVGRFAHHLFRSVSFQEEYYRFGKGIVADLWSTNFSEMRNILLAVPPRQEQAAIATFLDRETAKIDGLMEEQRRLIELLKEKRQATISHAVTEGLDPTAPMKNSGVEWLGDVPEHWRVAPLRYVAKVQTGVAKGKDLDGRASVTLPYLRVANVQDGYVDLTEMAEIEVLASDVARYLLKSGDVLMNEGGDFDKLGRGCVWNAQIDPCIHQNHVFAVRPISLTPNWLNLVTSSDYAQFYFMGRSKQSTNLASISSKNVMDLPVVVPPHNEQRAIVEHVSAVHAQIDALVRASHTAIVLLAEHRSALISAAVTGKIDVRSMAPPQEEAA